MCHLRMVDNQAFTKRRMSSDLIINAPPFLYLRQSNRLAFLFSPPQITLKNCSAPCPESYQPHKKRVKLLTCSDFFEIPCVNSDFRHSAQPITNQRLFITIFPPVFFQAAIHTRRDANRNLLF